MTAYVKPGSREEVGVITDFVDPQCGLLISLTLRAPDDQFFSVQCRQICPATH
jgi:hypothetical protein